jgi:hypothetical protein
MFILKVIESVLPCIIHTYCGAGRKAYEYMSFFRAFFAYCHFTIAEIKTLVETLRPDQNLRQLRGFRKVPGRAAFSRRLKDFSNADILDIMLDRLVKKAYRKLPVIHICRDSTAIESRERPKGKMKIPGTSSKQACLLVSSLDRKFIILARYIPRFENRVTTFSVVVNFPDQAPRYVPGLPIKKEGHKPPKKRGKRAKSARKPVKNRRRLRVRARKPFPGSKMR